jgi:hypothetical protein
MGQQLSGEVCVVALEPVDGFFQIDRIPETSSVLASNIALNLVDPSAEARYAK